MNVVKIKDKLYKYESFWRPTKQKKVYDFDKKPFPWISTEDISDKKWPNQENFLNKLAETQTYLARKNKFIKYADNDVKDCILNKSHHKISTGMYELNNIRWEDGLYHYIEKHNIKPTDDFIDFIFRHELDSQVTVTKHKLARVKGVMTIKKHKKYLKMDQNQIMIMDALFSHGSKKNYIGSKKKKLYRYSEHAGLLDFNDNGIEKIIVSGNTTRVDPNDNEIFMPQDIPDALDYEYIFHTHPATPKPGGRVTDGILYEFPSISDLFHFMDHYNDGETQGSIVIAAEGMYIIRKKVFDKKKIKINEDKFFRDAKKIWGEVQDDAIKKYKTKFSNDTFHSVIAQDTTYIDRLNKVLNKYELHIELFPRVKSDDGKRWIIDTMYLPIYVVEPLYK